MKANGIMIIATIAMACASAGYAQTIHQNDFNRFLGKVERAEFHPDSVEAITFVDWTLDTVDAENIHRWSWDHRNSGRDSLWFLLDTARQDPMAIPSGDQFHLMKRYRFYVMRDASGYGGASSILSVWKAANQDSFQLIGAQSSLLPDGHSVSWIAKRAIFPDQSILLCVQFGGGDAGDSWGGYSFLRSKLPDLFIPFYRLSWDSDDKVRVTCDFSDLFKPCYRMVETKTFFSVDNRWQNADDFGQMMDSARAQVVDLWDLAKERFAIDTIKIELQYTPDDQLEFKPRMGPQDK